MVLRTQQARRGAVMIGRRLDRYDAIAAVVVVLAIGVNLGLAYLSLYLGWE